MPNPRLIATIVAMLSVSGCRPDAAPEGPTPGVRTPEAVDLLVHGGRIHSFHPDARPGSVMAIRDGRIVAVGGEELLARFDATSRFDLQGRSAIPGLIDAHAHFMGLGRSKEELDLRGTRSLAEMIERVSEAAAKLPAGEPILGRGWNQELWSSEALPAHDELSAATPAHPVLLRRVDGHATLANARAMALAGITRSTASPPGGEILRDARGEPTGLFIDAACDLLPKPPAPSRAQLERWALAAQDACLSVGLTGMHDAGAEEDTIATFERLIDEGRLVMRLNVMLEGRFDERDVPEVWLARRLAAGVVTGGRDGHLSLRAVKIYADGSLGSRGAALLRAYADRPETTGLMQLSEASLLARVKACRAAGFQAAIHAIGDAANRAALDAFEAALEGAISSDHRFRVEHAQVVSPDDLPRFQALRVIASLQPTHATSDMNMAEERIGAERLRGAYAWRSLLSSGAHLAFGSDFPVESENPFWGLFSACERTDHAGKPAGGWTASEKVTREEALRAFTWGAAWAGFDEAEIGSLQAGRRADFLVLPADPLTCSAAELRDLRPDETWIGGRRVFARQEEM